MISGAIKSQVDKIWDAFSSGGISNPLEVLEQITYLLFLRRLDELHTLEENKAARLKKPMERRIYPEVDRLLSANRSDPICSSGTDLRIRCPGIRSSISPQPPTPGA